jgi:hypothetical protein
MTNYNEVDVATTLGRIWYEELEDIIEFDLPMPQDSYEIILGSINGSDRSWVGYLMGNEIKNDISKISKTTGDYYSINELTDELVDKLLDSAIRRIIHRVQAEYS